MQEEGRKMTTKKRRTILVRGWDLNRVSVTGLLCPSCNAEIVPTGTIGDDTLLLWCPSCNSQWSAGGMVTFRAENRKEMGKIVSFSDVLKKGEDSPCGEDDD